VTIGEWVVGLAVRCEETQSFLEFSRRNQLEIFWNAQSITLSGIIVSGIALALLSTLSNLFSEIWLLRDDAPRLDDNIKLLGVEGTVIKLSFRSTWLKTSEGNIVIMSNLTLYNGLFTNSTATGCLSKKFENKK